MYNMLRVAVLLFSFSTCFARFIVHPEVVPSVGRAWPQPQQYVSESTYFTVDRTKFYFSDSSKCDIIVDAMTRYMNIIFQGCQNSSSTFPLNEQQKLAIKNSSGDLPYLTIKIAGSCEKYPYENMDEQYMIEINTRDYLGAGILYSTTVWGALRGLETFSQLVYEIQPGVHAINTSLTLDFPRFSYRGVLLDTSRHFVPVPHLLANLDAMASVKMNVFHWHIVDDQSFPYVSKTFPELSEKGSFNPKTHTYSQKEIAQIIEYARLRGIRVVAEFDSPGHTMSWGNGRPDILTKCYTGSQWNGNYGPLDPSNHDVYVFLKSLFSEIGTVFPENYVHLGGDEVSFKCWQSNPGIRSFMKAHNISTYAKLEEYYMQNLLDIVKALNKSYVVWQEVFDNGVKIKKDTVVHVWKDGYKSELANVTGAGYNAILSSCWYLNYISYGNDWHAYYQCDPHDFKGSGDQKNLVIGGEACMWGEYVDGSNVISRTWPRAAAVAERLWSNISVTDINAAIPRLEEQRCRMLRRGIKVEPVSGPGYCECDYLL
ncbi:beta-hexosaminidase subunit alpha [Parasteatoda tepidariorum]|uniref:beta-hexosaminidase subunit alpha n=1 Tax=Parasteatoda tepidariorum TaxID=114398 RepID=UPI00077FC4E1|nr:beta-hexosaminidase subunit alpha [Parasteatoda tepidariorum]